MQGTNRVRDLVSVITPVFNGERFLSDAYDSLKSQKFQNWEWTVVDDCSTDNTWNILKNISASDGRVSMYSHLENLGAATARNTALKNSKGRFIAFLDVDDFWFPSKLNSQISFMLSNDCQISFSPFYIAKENGYLTTEIWDQNAPIEINYETLLMKKATFGCSTVIVDVDKAGMFRMPDLKSGQDYATWLKLLRKGALAHKYPEPVSAYRLVPGSVSRNKVKKAVRQWQIYRKHEGLGLRRSFYYFLNYAFRAIFRP